MSKFQRFLLTFGTGVLVFLTLGAWSFASPVGSSPDDDFHLASIWCGQGERAGLCMTGSNEESRLVPSKAITSVCFAFNPNVTASCQGSEFAEANFDLVETTRVNTGTQYPSGYFWVASFFASENISVSTVLIRLLNSLIFSVLVISAWIVLPKKVRPVLAASVVLTFIPLGFFIVASVNPSSWALTSAVVLLPTLIGWFITTGRTHWLLGCISVIAASLGLASRGDSGIYVLIAALAATILAFRPHRSFYFAALLPLALAFAGVLAFFAAGQTSLALSGDSGIGETEENPTSKLALSAINLVSLPSLWAGAFGQGWGLGWLDTAMPAIVPGIGIFLVSGVLFTALRALNFRRSVTLFGIGIAATVIPVYILVQSFALVGQEVQPRYILPLITMFVAAAISPNFVSHSTDWQTNISLSRLQVWVIAFGATVSQSVSLFANLRRNVTTGSYNLDGATDWWWNFGPSPFTVFIVGSIAWAFAMIMFVWGWNYQEPSKEHQRFSSTTFQDAA